MTILIIEDELNLANSLKNGLLECGYKVDLALNGKEGLEKALAQKYKLIISDIILPELNGLDFCREYRKQDNITPIIFLTALGTTADKLKGFELGAEDYISKPFSFQELIARIKVIEKRYTINSNETSLLIADTLRLNTDSKTVERNETPILLTEKEFQLLVYFLKNKNSIISKKEIAEEVWGINFETGTNSIEVYVNFLRNKIDKNFDKKLIHTVHGRGYILKEN